MKTLRPYQIKGIQWLASRQHGLLGDQMGLGKTAQYVGAAEQVAPQGRILIVAPEATLPGLARQIREWSQGTMPITTLGRRGAPAPAKGWILLGWTSAKARLEDILAGPRLDVLILDESHRVKNPTAQVTRAVLGQWRKSEAGQWTRSACLAAHADRVWAATGTPIPNRPIELQPLLHLGFAQRWASRNAYGDKYCKQSNRWAPRGFDYLGARNLQQLNQQLISAGVLLRRTAEDLPGELPTLTSQLVPLAVKDVVLPGLDPEAVAKALGEGGTVPFDQMSAYRAEMGVRKIPACRDWIVDWCDDNEDEALVVFCWHKDVVEALAKMLEEEGIETLYAHGDMSPEDRQAKVDLFAAGNARVFIGTISACGTGLNGLHQRTTTCAFAECCWTPGELEQAIGRVRRLGSKNEHAHAYILAGEDSLEAHILQTILGKLEISQTVLADSAAGTTEEKLPEIPQLPADLPCPETGWTWAKLNSGDWGVRLGVPGFPDWAGAQIQVRSRSGEVKKAVLGARVACGNEWSLWSLVPPTVEEVAKAKLDWALGRTVGIQGEPLTGAELVAAEAAWNACAMIDRYDADRGMEKNDIGWAGCTRSWGSRLAQVLPKLWDSRALQMARNVLAYHRRTQVPADLAAQIWTE